TSASRRPTFPPPARSGRACGVRPLSLLLVSLLLPVSPARADLVIGRDARTGVSLTIYGQQDLALVRETRSAELGTGEEALRFDEVAAGGARGTLREGRAPPRSDDRHARRHGRAGQLHRPGAELPERPVVAA